MISTNLVEMEFYHESSQESDYIPNNESLLTSDGNHLPISLNMEPDSISDASSDQCVYKYCFVERPTGYIFGERMALLNHYWGTSSDNSNSELLQSQERIQLLTLAYESDNDIFLIHELEEMANDELMENKDDRMKDETQQDEDQFEYEIHELRLLEQEENEIHCLRDDDYVLANRTKSGSTTQDKIAGLSSNSNINLGDHYQMDENDQLNDSDGLSSSISIVSDEKNTGFSSINLGTLLGSKGEWFNLPSTFSKKNSSSLLRDKYLNGPSCSFLHLSDLSKPLSLVGLLDSDSLSSISRMTKVFENDEPTKGHNVLNERLGSFKSVNMSHKLQNLFASKLAENSLRQSKLKSFFQTQKSVTPRNESVAIHASKYKVTDWMEQVTPKIK